MSTDAKEDSGSAAVERVSRRVESLDPGKIVLMPDIYADKCAVREFDVETVDESPAIAISCLTGPH